MMKRTQKEEDDCDKIFKNLKKISELQADDSLGLSQPVPITLASD